MTSCGIEHFLEQQGDGLGVVQDLYLKFHHIGPGEILVIVADGFRQCGDGAYATGHLFCHVTEEPFFHMVSLLGLFIGSLEFLDRRAHV